MNDSNCRLFDLFFKLILLGNILTDITNPTPACSVRGVLSAHSPHRTTLVDNSIALMLVPIHCVVVANFTVLKLVLFGRVRKRVAAPTNIVSFRLILPTMVGRP